MYERVGEITEARRLALLSKAQDWVHKRGQGMDFWACVLDGRRMFIRICPEGRVHPHCDDAGPKLHIVLETCDGARCRSGDQWYDLEQRGIYRMDPAVEHEAINLGASDRTHLVLS